MGVILVNPKTTWNLNEKYNYDDINKVEGNMSLIFNYYDALGYVIPVTSFVTNRTLTDRDDVNSVNRLEDNLEALAMGIMYPPNWGVKVTWDRSVPFTYNDANRWERNLVEINEWATRIEKEYKYSGTFSSGQEVIL